MKDNFLLLTLIILLSSCSDYGNDPTRYESAGTLYLQDELKEYFDYYKANETLRFKKENNGHEIIGHETIDRLIDPEGGNQSDLNEYWTFTGSGVPEVHTEYGEEEQQMVYRDENGNRITLLIRSRAYVPRSTEEWVRVQDQFTLKYSEPCTSTYIDYMTKAYRTDTWSIKKESILVPSMEVGGTIYHDVIQLKTIKEGSHFAFYVTKLDGIIKIDNLDMDITWIKE